MRQSSRRYRYFLSFPQSFVTFHQPSPTAFSRTSSLTQQRSPSTSSSSATTAFAVTKATAASRRTGVARASPLMLVSRIVTVHLSSNTCTSIVHDCLFVFSLEINECESNPCVYGTCSDYLLYYECTCFAGYSGDTCETGQSI